MTLNQIPQLQINDKFISYIESKSKKKDDLTIIFLHGLRSNMMGKKAVKLEEVCIDQGLHYIRFDNFGHGQSSGEFQESKIGDWLEGLEHIVENLAQKEVILIGSSMGGWISMLFAQKYPNKVKAVIGVAAAPDFTEELMWKKLPQAKQQELVEKGLVYVKSADGRYTYPIRYDFIREARNHLIMQDDSLNIQCPIQLVHGKQDLDVPYDTVFEIKKRLPQKQVSIITHESGDHSLSDEEGIKMISDSLLSFVTC